MKWKHIILIIISTPLLACMESMQTNSVDKGKNFESEGERIYFTGKSSKGSSIEVNGGNHHMQMHYRSCVACHGVDREGSIMWPRFWLRAPSITSSALTENHEDGHDHSVYNSNTLKKAIVEGVNPAGHKLNEVMPRWNMSVDDLNALSDYLLEGEKSH